MSLLKIASYDIKGYNEDRRMEAFNENMILSVDYFNDGDLSLAADSWGDALKELESTLSDGLRGRKNTIMMPPAEARKIMVRVMRFYAKMYEKQTLGEMT